LPIKEAKKALRGIVLGQELLQKIENAMQEKDQATMIDILAYTKEKPPRDAEVAKLLDVCRQRVASSLKAVRTSTLRFHIVCILTRPKPKILKQKRASSPR
jgi:hypothetical protein